MAEYKVVVAIILAMVITAAATSAYFITRPKPAPPPGPATVTGKIIDAKTGDPLAGVEVTVDGYSTSTGTDGTFTILLKVGDYTLTVSKKGYESKSVPLSVAEEKVYTQDFSIARVPYGTFRVGWTTEVNSLNPTTCWSDEGGLAIDAMFDALYRISREASPEPDLVVKETISPDGLTWDLEIVEDATWSDGAPLNADSVVYNFKVLLKTMPPLLMENLEFIDSIEKMGEYSVRLRLKHPMPLDLAKILLSDIYIFIREQELGPADEVTLDAVLNYAPEETKITNGPFKMVEWKKGERIVLEANGEYWRGAPNIERLVFVRYMNAEAMAEGLLAGQIDATYERIPPPMVRKVQETSGFGVAITKSWWLNDIIFNMQDWNEYMRPALLQPEVRKAFAMSMDWDKAIRVVWLGYAEPNPSIIPNAGVFAKYYNESLKYYEFNPEKARKLLEEHGWKDLDGDGWLEKEITYTIKPLALKDGKIQVDEEGNLVRVPEDQWITKTELYELDFDVWIETSYEMEVKWFEVMKPDLQRAGINIKVHLVEGSVLYDKIWGADGITADFDIIGWGWNIGFDPTYIMGWLSAYQIGGWSDSCYHEPEFNRLYMAQKYELDEAERIRMIKRMQWLVYRDLPYIIMCWPDWIQGYSEEFTGYVSMPLRGIINQYTFTEIRVTD